MSFITLFTWRARATRPPSPQPQSGEPTGRDASRLAKRLDGWRAGRSTDQPAGARAQNWNSRVAGGQVSSAS